MTLPSSIALERRIHKVDRIRLPLPYGLPLRSIAYALLAGLPPITGVVASLRVGEGRGVIGLRVEEMQSAIRDCSKPVIARVNGIAFGSGELWEWDGDRWLRGADIALIPALGVMALWYLWKKRKLDWWMLLVGQLADMEPYIAIGFIDIMLFEFFHHHLALNIQALFTKSKG